MAIENSVSDDFLSTIFDNINVLDGHLPHVILLSQVPLHDTSYSDYI